MARRWPLWRTIAAAIDDARLRRIEDELAALKARLAAMRFEPDPADAERA